MTIDDDRETRNPTHIEQQARVLVDKAKAGDIDAIGTVLDIAIGRITTAYEYDEDTTRARSTMLDPLPDDVLIDEVTLLLELSTTPDECVPLLVDALVISLDRAGHRLKAGQPLETA